MNDELADIMEQATKDLPPLVTKKPLLSKPLFPECKFNQMGGTIKGLRTDIPFREALLEALTLAYVAGADYDPDLLA